MAWGKIGWRVALSPMGGGQRRDVAVIGRRGGHWHWTGGFRDLELPPALSVGLV